MGVPEEDRGHFAEQLLHRPDDHSLGGTDEKAMAKNPLEFLYEQFSLYVADRREHPTDDVLTGLASRCTATGPGETFERMTTLAALAGATTRIRLGLLVVGVTYRHPSLYAAQALTIDHASNGRLELSFGVAWFEDEHRELGMRFPSLGKGSRSPRGLP